MIFDINKIKVGSDPEFFVKKDGEFFPSFNIIEGSKEDPQDIGNGYQILKDNVLLEGNIPPANSRDEFIHNLQYIKKYFSQLLEDQGMTLECADSGRFKRRFLRHWEANVFGCDPYMNAWDNEEHMADDMSDMDTRVAGFHIHIGYNQLDNNISKENIDNAIARAFDYFVVYPARKEYNDPIRSKYYGAYGNYRNKPYGLECRSLGGYFLKDKYLGWIYDNVMKMMQFVNCEENINKLNNLEMDQLKFDESGYSKLGVNLTELLFKE